MQTVFVLLRVTSPAFLQNLFSRFFEKSPAKNFTQKVFHKKMESLFVVCTKFLTNRRGRRPRRPAPTPQPCGISLCSLKLPCIRHPERSRRISPPTAQIHGIPPLYAGLRPAPCKELFVKSSLTSKTSLKRDKKYQSKRFSLHCGKPLFVCTKFLTSLPSPEGEGGFCGAKDG